MALHIGIIGLPNVGKSTMFNILTRTRAAESANYPFCTIEPNRAIVPVPDQRLQQIAAIAKPQKVTPATVEFVDIAGLVKGASRGEGLGNKFLANVRDADALLHVVRCFEDENIAHVDGSIDPVRDIETIETELLLADIQTLESRLERLQKNARADKSLATVAAVAETLLEHLNSGRPASMFTDRESKAAVEVFRDLRLLTDKPVIFCANAGEEALSAATVQVEAVRAHAEKAGNQAVVVSARMEEELCEMNNEERTEFLTSYGIAESGLDQTIRLGYAALGLISYITAGPKEVRAWTIHRGWTAPRAAGIIHTDFERGFIRAQVIAFDDFIACNGETGARAAGLMRTEGRDYVVKDGDVIEFLFNV